MHNFGLKARLLAILALSSACLMAASLFGTWMLWHSLQTFEHQVETARTSQRDILVTQTDFKKQVQEWKDVLLRGGDPEALARHWGKFEQQESQVQANAAAIVQRLPEGAARQAVSTFAQAHEQMGAAYRHGLEAFKAAHFDPHAGDVAVKGIDRNPTELLTQATSAIDHSAESLVAQASQQAANAVRISLVTLVLTLAIAFASCAWWLERSLVRPARAITLALGRLANGDFTGSIAHQGNDELGNIARSSERIRDELGAMIGEVSTLVVHLGKVTRELLEVNQRVERGSEEQTRATSSTAAAIEQMAASIQSVAGIACEVRDRAGESRDTAQRGNAGLDLLSSTIACTEQSVQTIDQQIADFLRRTSEISGMTAKVKELAEQTNLLALNAAIEAARAGEHGRGFAVVADEVRKLDERSASAAVSIEGITRALESESSSVEEGLRNSRTNLSSAVMHAGEIGQVVLSGVACADRAAQGITVISSAVQEQMAAANEIAHLAETVQQMAQQNETAIASAGNSIHQLSGMATTLQTRVSQFTVHAQAHSG